MWAVIFLFLAGVTLIFAEFFVPGGMLGVLGGGIVIASTALGWYRYPEYGVYILVAELAGVFVTVSVGLYLLLKTPLGRRFVLSSNQLVEEGYSAYGHDEEQAQLIGRTATVNTPLRPAGSILLDGRRIDAVSNGTYIDRGKQVRIVEVEGYRVVCEEAVDVEAEEQPA